MAKVTRCFKKVLIANRGEIAVRVIQTVQQMGMAAVAVYSEPDANAKHVVLADEAWPLEGQTSAESYLDIQKIMAVAQQAGVDAIHPGYGFLSENAQFARACQQAGIVFIGPTPDVIEAMGDKITAKALMQQSGVPVVPGWVGDATATSEMKKAAKAIGYPILVKAAAGGGGKGMRLVEQDDTLEEAVQSAAREAQNAFGDARIFLEKYVTRPRHVEFQVLGDQHGNVVHLFERECSIQRRHQKIIEETPSPALTPQLRQQMGEAAVKAAQAMQYTNAGTVEFIVDADGAFYFLEVNTRLQVEHPITECVVRQDLVQLQLQIAMGQPLPFVQTDVEQNGHAIECRIYAEDPQNQFLPSTGTLHVYKEPSGPGIRVDSGVQQGAAVSVYYDPMLAKLVTWAPSREVAINKMQWALRHYPILGVTTNITFLSAILAHPAFLAGDIDTHFLQHHAIEKPDAPEHIVRTVLPAIMATASQNQSHQFGAVHASSSVEPWQQAGAWRGV